MDEWQFNIDVRVAVWLANAILNIQTGLTTKEEYHTPAGIYIVRLRSDKYEWSFVPKD